MPTKQEEEILMLVGGMKAAVKRGADDSDSDESVQQITNRGNKLKKKAKFVHEGQLGLPNGPQVYKKTIDYNGFQREIISERPPLFDDDGYEMSSDEDEEGEALATANEFYPYNDVRIEDILAPLAAASDLPDHPTLARPFTSKTLTELTNHARLMAQKEKNSLWRLKHMLTKLSGDHTWIPTAMLETPNDLEFFGDGRAEYRAHLMEKDRIESGDAGPRMIENGTAEDTEMDGTAVAENEELSESRPPPQQDAEKDDVEMGEAGEPSSKAIPEQHVEPTQGQHNAEPSDSNAVDDAGKPDEQGDKTVAKQPTADDPKQQETEAKIENTETALSKTADTTEKAAEEDQAEDPDSTLLDPEVEAEAGVTAKDESGEANDEDEGEEDGEGGDKAPPRRMRTRAQAQAASDGNAPSRNRSLSATSNDSFVHPYFLAPATSIPDRDFMLPIPEADETRRLLQLYIQKQEEICRGAEKLYMGLLKADQLRKQVMTWARAERHVGEMSDGEDWVDEELWNLDEPLKKGMDDEEEEAVPTGKKTRARRQ